MKRYIFKALFLLMAFSFATCTDLEEEPVGILSPVGFFNSTRDVETAIFGSYGLIASESMYGRKLVLTLQLRGDMCDIGDRGTPARRQQVNDFNMDALNGMVTAFWPRMYQVIASANSAISGAEGLGLSEDVGNPLIAEARFVRAFTYYHLVRLFGDIPYIDFFIDNPESVTELSKTSAAEVYTNIIADLEFAKQWLPDEQPASTRTRPSKGTAAAYLSSVYLTNQDFSKAYEEAKWVIDNKGRFGYGLMGDFQELFDATNADGLAEHLFIADFLGNQTGPSNQNTDWMGPITGIRGSDDQGWSVSVPAMGVFDSWDERDYRRTVSMDDTTLVDGEPIPYTEFANTQRPHIAKFMRFCGNSRGDCGQSDNNYPAMRYAEVLLIAAEALNETSGPTAEAQGYVNEIRARARNWAGTMTNFPEDVPGGLSADEFRTLVLEERRIELAFEFKRLYDIKRRDMGNEFFKGTNSLEPHDNFDPSRDYLFPLPADELDRNGNLGPQNPGY